MDKWLINIYWRLYKNWWIDDLSIFTEDFIKNYNINSDIWYIFEADIKYPKHIRIQDKDLAFLPERMKFNKYTKLTCTIQNKKNYVIHTLALQQALNHGLKLSKLYGYW